VLSQLWACAERLAADGIAAGVVSLPWLRDVDGAWLRDVAGGAPVVTVDNHYVDGGQGDAVLRALGGGVHRIGVESVPACGSNDEVLRHHGLDGASLAAKVAALLPSQVR
jgi:transketolase